MARSATHHPNLQQMLCKFAVTKFKKVGLRLTKNNLNPRVLAALGDALVACISHIPHGVLVFFPSYSFSTTVLESWQQSGLLSALGQRRRLFFERSAMTGEQVAEAIREYKAVAQQARGAVLFAVMRGRCSEGADFRDHCARGVVVVGVPYPLLSTETLIMKEYNATTFGHRAGDHWYEGEAMRTVNQAAGRLVRHARDFGCLVLLDERYGRPSDMLSAWIRKDLPVATKSLPTEIHEFFAARLNEVPLRPKFHGSEAAVPALSVAAAARSN